MKQLLNDWKVILIACLTLGLAPFFPEPHLFGKLKWLFGDSTGMQAIDVFDLVFHSLPWILLIRCGIIKLFKLKRNGKQEIVQ